MINGFNLHHQHFLSKFKEKNENDMTFWYLSCLDLYFFLPTFMPALPAQAAADTRLTGLYQKTIIGIKFLAYISSSK